MPNRIDLVVHYLACFRAGLIATPLNYRYTHREIDQALAVSGARALLAHAERGRNRPLPRRDRGAVPRHPRHLTMRFGDEVEEVSAGSAVRVAPRTPRSHRNPRRRAGRDLGGLAQDREQ